MLTVEEENELFGEELRDLQTSVPLMQGSSWGGKEIPELSDGIPTNPSVVVCIDNYLNVPLSLPRSYHFDSGSSTLKDPVDVQARTSEVVCVQHLAPKAKISAQLGFSIPNTDRKLFINLEALRDGRAYIGLSFGPNHMQVGERARSYIWYGTDYDTFRADTRRNGKEGTGGELFVSHGELRAWGEISHCSKAIVRVTVWSETEARGLMRGWKSSLGEISRLIGTVRMPFACRVILENNSKKINLIEHELFINQGMIQACMSNVLGPSESGAVLVSDSKSAEGLVAYKIGKADFKLVVAFWVGASKSSYSLSFVQAEKGTDSELFSSLSAEPEDWTRAHFKSGSSSGGEQEIQIRNVVARASMSKSRCSSSKARHTLLRVSVQVCKSSTIQ